MARALSPRVSGLRRSFSSSWRTIRSIVASRSSAGGGGLHPDRQLDARFTGVVEPALPLGDHDDAGLVVAVAVGRGVDAVVLEVRRGRRVRLGVLGADVVGEQRLIRVDEDDSVDLGVPLRGRARHEPGTARTEATATPCLVTASYGM